MVKYIQTIRREIADELFECVWKFCEIGAKRVKYKMQLFKITVNGCFSQKVLFETFLTRFWMHL